jgi:SAM-dependent methyltransferase
MPETAPFALSGGEILEKMRRDWDERARENARHYVATSRTDWSDQDYFESGRENVRREILTDMTNICQGQDPRQMSVLEIGCGSGRVTRALAEVFGHVYAVDISGEMIRQARQALADLPNVSLFQNNGRDLSVLADIRVDFAFSYIVFQHIPSRDVIYSYARDVARVLRPGRLFKFQVQGDATLLTSPADTWLGVPFSDDDAVLMAEECGFEPRFRHGAGTQYFWLWYFRR